MSTALVYLSIFRLFIDRIRAEASGADGGLHSSEAGLEVLLRKSGSSGQGVLVGRGISGTSASGSVPKEAPESVPSWYISICVLPDGLRALPFIELFGSCVLLHGLKDALCPSTRTLASFCTD